MTGDVNLTHIRHALLFIYEGANESVERDALAQLAQVEAVIEAARKVAWFEATRVELRDALAALEDGQ